MGKLIGASFCAALLVTPMVSAAQQPIPRTATEPSNLWTLIGTGQFSCGKFIDYQRQKDEAQLDLIVQWIWGFMSAYNMRGSFHAEGVRVTQIKDLPDQPTVLLFVEKYCNVNPTHKLTQATFALMDALGAELELRLRG